MKRTYPYGVEALLVALLDREEGAEDALLEGIALSLHSPRRRHATYSRTARFYILPEYSAPHRLGSRFYTRDASRALSEWRRLAERERAVGDL